VNDDRITYQQLSQLDGSRDKRAAHAVDNAVRGVNAAESTIRQTAAMIRSELEETVRRLDLGLSLNDLGELQRMPADLDRAITLRQHHWQVLGALLIEAELNSLQPAASARRRMAASYPHHDSVWAGMSRIAGWSGLPAVAQLRRTSPRSTRCSSKPWGTNSSG